MAVLAMNVEWYKYYYRVQRYSPLFISLETLLKRENVSPTQNGGGGGVCCTRTGPGCVVRPGSLCRRLYAGVVRSIALYGAPIWIDALTAGNWALLQKPQRVIAVWYKRVSYGVVDCGDISAGDQPWELQAEVLAEVYRAEARNDGDRLGYTEVGRIKAIAQQALIVR
nr:uncharacterized protein LOC113397796 [Vanessa tameamea]